MVAAESQGVARAGWEQEEGALRLVARRVLQAALRAVREPALRMAHMGWPARWVLGVGELPPLGSQNAGEAHLHLPRPGLGGEAARRGARRGGRRRGEARSGIGSAAEVERD